MIELDGASMPTRSAAAHGDDGCRIEAVGVEVFRESPFELAIVGQGPAIDDLVERIPIDLDQLCFRGHRAHVA
jgi:hypothetical protein